MAKEIRIEEGKLKVIFEIRDNGVVELKQLIRQDGRMCGRENGKRRIFIRSPKCR